MAVRDSDIFTEPQRKALLRSKPQSKKSHDHNVSPRWLMLDKIEDEEIAEHLVKRSVKRSKYVQGCERLIGSSAGLYAAALFADSFLTAPSDPKTPEETMRDAMSPFFQCLKRLSIQSINVEVQRRAGKKTSDKSLLEVVMFSPTSCATSDPFQWTTRETVMSQLTKFKFESFDVALSDVLCYPPEVDADWIRLHSRPFMTNDVLGKVWLAPTGKEFSNKKILTVARTDRSGVLKFGLNQTYERLEFLGDSILSLLITEWLHEVYPDLREGPLSQAKSILQGNNFIARKMIRRVIDYNKLNRSTLKASQLLLADFRNLSDVDRLQEALQTIPPENDFRQCWDETVADIRVKVKGDIEVKPETLLDFGIKTTKHKKIADLYESLIASTYIDSHFDLLAVWCAIAQDLENSETHIRKLLTDKDFLLTLNVRATETK